MFSPLGAVGRVGAPGGGGARPGGDAARGRRVCRRRGDVRRRRALPLPAARRHRGARSGGARPGGRRARGERRRRSPRLCLAPRRLGRASVARDGAVRAAPGAAGRVSRRDGATAAAAGAGRHGGGTDAGGRLPGDPQLGLRRGAAVRPDGSLRQPGRAEGAGGRGARAGADDVPRRRLQSLRSRRKLPARLRGPVLPFRQHDAVGRGDRLPPAGGGRVLCPQRALLAERISFRRAALRRGARDQPARRAARARRRHPRRHPPRAAGASGAGARRQSRLPAARRAGPWGLRRAVERRHPPLPAPAADRRGRRLLRRLRRARPGNSPAASPRALPGKARSRPIATTSRAASRAGTCRPRPSSASCRTTTRSATGRSANG